MRDRFSSSRSRRTLFGDLCGFRPRRGRKLGPRFPRKSFRSVVLVFYRSSPLLLPAEAFLAFEDAVPDPLRNRCRDSGPCPVKTLSQLSSEIGKRELFVAVLASLVLAHDGQPRRPMAQSHGGIALVHVLSAVAARAKSMDLALGQ